MAKFIVLYNGEPLKTFELDEPVITIGRLPENTISIANMGVSRRHARIEEDTERSLIIIDLNSLNGTFVNGKKIKKVELNDGDKISIGKYVIIYRSETNAAQPSAAEMLDASVQFQKNPPEAPDPVPANTDTNTYVPPSIQPAVPPAQTSNAEQMVPGISVLIETGKHVVYKLDKQYITLGSGETDDIFISGFMVGKSQVSIEKHNDGMYISAQKLMGKLKVNGKTVKTQMLKHKDRIEIGASTFRFMENG